MSPVKNVTNKTDVSKKSSNKAVFNSVATNKTMVLKPRMSEKSYGAAQVLNVYVFDVPATANKITVENAIAEQFGVSVVGVNIAVVKGKAKRTVRKSGRSVHGKRSNVKKAYVTIKQGESIPVFAAVEEAEKKAEKAQKVADKAATKAAKKEKN